jgi:hypothetical protein
MKVRFWFCLLAVVLVFSIVSGAFAQFADPYPGRESKLIASFEDEKLDGWISDPEGTGGNARASFNKDPKYASDGKGSMILDLTDIGGWKEPVLSVDFEEPIDMTGYNAFSMDVYVPAEALYPDRPGGWFQFLPRIVSANGTAYFGNRDVHVGWNRLVWTLYPDKTEGVTRIHFASNTDGERPWTAPIYVDNIRIWKDKWPGLHPDETLILGFDKASDLDMFTVGEGASASFNSDKQFIIQGDGSIKIDMTDMQGWHGNWFSTQSLPSVDLSKAIAVRLDVFVPDESHPTDWWQLGIGIGSASGMIWTETKGLNAGMWDTIELILTPEQAATLTAVTNFGMRTNGGNPWTGPIYIDNLRAVIPAPPPPAVVPGDLNGDGKVGIPDATLALQIAVGLQKATDAQLAAGDLNKNGKIDIAEVTRILRAAVGMEKLS